MSYDGILTHLTMLRDAVRTDGYRRAIEEVVRPGDRVMDFGCGTGVLSIFAERAGAGRVYAVDRSRMVDAARRIASDNGCTRIEFFAGEAMELDLPSQVDVIVSEWMGHFLFAEAMLEPLLRLRDRYLAPGGRIVPSVCTLHASFLTSDKHFQELAFLRTRPYGIDFRAVSEWPMCEPQAVKVAASELLPESACIGTVDLLSASAMPGLLSGVITPRAAATAYGLCGWFDAQLSPNVSFSTSPRAPATHWLPAVFPFAQPLQLVADEPVEVSVEPVSVDDQNAFVWRARARSGERSGDSMVHRAPPARIARARP